MTQKKTDLNGLPSKFPFLKWPCFLQLDENIPASLGPTDQVGFLKTGRMADFKGAYRFEFTAIGSWMLKRVPRPGSLSQ